MIKWLKNIFTSNADEEEQEKQQEKQEKQEKQEEVAPPPEQIEIPWKIAAAIYNYDMATKKVFADLKEFLYEEEVKKKALWDAAENFTNMKEEAKAKIMAIYKEKLNIPEDVIYDFKGPEATGRSAFLKKKKE